MKNVQKVAGLVLLSTVLFSTNAFAGGSKSGGPAALHQITVPATHYWLQ